MHIVVSQSPFPCEDATLKWVALSLRMEWIIHTNINLWFHPVHGLDKPLHLTVPSQSELIQRDPSQLCVSPSHVSEWSYSISLSYHPPIDHTSICIERGSSTVARMSTSLKDHNEQLHHHTYLTIGFAPDSRFFWSNSFIRFIRFIREFPSSRQLAHINYQS